MHSEDYQAQLLELRASRPSAKPWGTTGARNFGEYVAKYIKDHNGWIKSVLDYGCGTASLGKFVQERVDVEWTNYDPGVVEYSTAPSPDEQFDLVTSSDVLEHVEPDMLAGTLEECSRFARRAQYHHIACEACSLTLPDGRNAHLSLHTPEEWRVMIEKGGWKTQYWTRELERKRGQLKLACKILVEK
jgi:SAM-dependent methyltransferase